MFSGEKSRETSWRVISEIGGRIPPITGCYLKHMRNVLLADSFLYLFFFSISTLAVKKANHLLFKGFLAQLTRSNFCKVQFEMIPLYLKY